MPKTYGAQDEGSNFKDAMTDVPSISSRAETLRSDLTAGLVVFLVALPLCLGIAVASGASPISGILSGIIGGLVIGVLSASHTSVSGPAAGLTAVVLVQLKNPAFGDTPDERFQAFLLAVLIAGVIQIILGAIRAGFLSAFFPGSVIKGLLAAIGVILILKQIPHLLGHDTDPEGEMSYVQPDHETTFSEIGKLFTGEVHSGAIIVGLASVVLLVWWDKSKWLKKLSIPGPLVVVVFGVAMAEMFRSWGGEWVVSGSHLVSVPVANSLAGLTKFLTFPDFTQFTNSAVWVGGMTIAIVASLETLLNLEAVDKLDKLKRNSPPSRELVAQGIGNVVAGLIGALPVTSVVVRSSVNVNAGGKTKLSAIAHGVLLVLAVVFFPTVINMIPLSALAAILIVTGFKLANPQIFVEMYREGKFQFLPFIATVLAIVFTDLLIGIVIGLVISVSFILYSNLKRPIRKIVEKHISGDVMRIELASQVSFLNRVALENVLMDVPRGGNVLLDGRNTVFMDPDATYFIRDFVKNVAPARGIHVSLVGFRDSYVLDDRVLYVDYCSRELQETMTPQQAIEILQDGNERFRTGRQLTRDLNRQMTATSDGQHPLAVVLSCIDSRNPVEIVFDLGLGDIFSTRIAGNTVNPQILGSLEYGCAVAGAKLVLVMGHTRCGAVTEAVNRLTAPISATTAVCKHLTHIVEDIQQAVDDDLRKRLQSATGIKREELVDEVSRLNVTLVLESILDRSDILREMAEKGRIAIAGGIYNVSTGEVDIFPHMLRQPEAALT